MRRRPADSTAAKGGRDDAGKAERHDKPRFEKPRFDKADANKSARPAQQKSRPAVAYARAAPAEPHEKAFEGERVAKAMARAGVCSRRDAEQWIAEGRVAVNGRVLSTPAVNVREEDKITVDGAPMVERERTRLFLFHKPAGLVTSAKDPEGRETVFDFLKERHPDLPRVVSVGRLDINTEGLLLLTNDGGLARTLELPATGWTRRYRVRAHGQVDQAMLDTLAKGVTVDDVTYAPIEARLDRVQGANAWISMSLSEGKNREIKRVLEHLVLDVTRLIRISYGPFQLGDIGEGAVEEVKLKVLRDQLGKGLAELAGVDFSSGLRETPSATEAQEARVRSEGRPRKHVSTLRKQRDQGAEQAPRARIERAVTADRKGRAIAVERVVVKGQKPAADNRNARRFDALRRDNAAPESGGPRQRSGEGRPAPRGEGGGRFERRDASPPQGDFKKARAPRGDDAGRFERGAPSRARAVNRERKEFRDARPPRGDAPRARNFDRNEGRPSAQRPPRTEGGAPPRERAEGRERREFKDARPPRGDAPRTRNFDRSEGRSSGPRPPRADSGARSDARPSRAKTSGPRERSEFKDARAPRSEGAPRDRNFARSEGRASGPRPPRSEGGKKFDGPPKPGGAGKPRGPGRPGGGKPRGKPPARSPR
jgi:23S rRNA pseudouridine2605 synthase